MPERIDVAVIGAGVVGLAIARRLAMAGREVVVLEAEAGIGTQTSSRNSEVIHAGIHGAPGSLKARLCVAGNAALYAYCAAHGVPHRRIGKLIVAVADDEVAQLERYRAQAAANGAVPLEWLAPDEVRALEPTVRCVRALLSPSTGILDSHALMRALERDAASNGAHVLLRSPVRGGRAVAGGIELEVGGAEATTVRCAAVVNAAGLGAQAVARSISGVPASSIPPLHLAKGHYFALRHAPPFARLVYPVAGGGGLGIHLTLDLAGRARFGPDVCWIDRVDYGFDEGRAAAFYAAVRRYYPELADGALVPDTTGIRPKLAPQGAPVADFSVQGPADHGVPGLIGLYGIESPGLTSCLALAELVLGLL